MTRPVDRYRRPSPRTAELPMAFTRWEFTRGALIAWLGFNLLAPLVIAGSAIAAGLLIPHNSGIGYSGATLVIAPIILVPWSLGAALILGAVGWRLTSIWALGSDAMRSSGAGPQSSIAEWPCPSKGRESTLTCLGPVSAAARSPERSSRTRAQVRTLRILS